VRGRESGVKKNRRKLGRKRVKGRKEQEERRRQTNQQEDTTETANLLHYYT
jgi:hypothetical protein